MRKEIIFKFLPDFLQNFIISFINWKQYKTRYNKEYKSFKAYLKLHEFDSFENLKEIQNQRFIEFLKYVKANSPYYSGILSKINVNEGINVLKQIPIISKDEFIANIPYLITGKKNELLASKTGGTTGASIEVYYRNDDVQRRFAFLDNFRERFGYKLGVRTGWFSGKDLISKKNEVSNIYWKTDFFNNVRFYSTFNINDKTSEYYLKDIKKYKPSFLVGFPSSIVELARYGKRNKIKLGYNLQAIFPTAESKNPSEADDMKDFFGCGVHDQYASSEGACFITECETGNLHFELLSGIIEVIDEEDNDASEGKMLITSFDTKGTPLLRYDIGDRMKWSQNKSCSCGRKTPLVEEIQGRINDFVYSEEYGKCNLGNLSNCVKYVKGVRKFQVIQDEIERILVRIARTEEFGEKDKNLFELELRARLGNKIIINFEFVEDIPKEKSGKYRIVKNSIPSNKMI